MSELIDTTEMYLRTIYELEEEGEIPRRARITERLGHSGPTVSQTVARMERDGLVVVTPERHLELTEAGRQRAVTVMRRHRLAELLLVHVLDLEVEHVHEEACRLEHVLTTRVERKILALLPDITTSPYGNPIPGLSELLEGADAPEEFLSNLVPLTETAPGDVITVRRIGEPAQGDPAVLAALQAAGILPGQVCFVADLSEHQIEPAQGVTGLPDDLVLRAKSGKKGPVRLPAELAAHVFVQPSL